MKKTMLICMLMLLCVLFAACEDTKPVETTAAVVTTTTPVETTAPVEMTAVTTDTFVEDPVYNTLTAELVSVTAENENNHYSVRYTNPDGTAEYTYSVSLPATYTASGLVFTSEISEFPRIILADAVKIDALPTHDANGNTLSDVRSRFLYAVGTMLHTEVAKSNGTLHAYYESEINGEPYLIYSGKGESYFYAAFYPIDADTYAPIVFCGDISIVHYDFVYPEMESVLRTFQVMLEK